MSAAKEKSEVKAADGAGGSQPQPLAIIDIGTSAARMDIAEIRSDGAVRVLDSLQQPVHLGRDTFSGGRIRQATIEECVGVLKGFRRAMAEYGVTREDQMRAVATSTILEAENRDAFIDRVYIATGINIVPIEEAEVNRLTYVGLYRLLEKEPSLKEGNVLAVEVGGGSTKLLLIQDGHLRYASVFRLGSVRMRETLERHRTPSDRIRAVLDQHIQRTIEQMRHSVPADSCANVVAIAGDMHFAMSRLVPDWDKSGVTRMPSGSFSIAEKVAVTPVDELVRKHRLPYHEAEAAGPALLAYVRVARAFKAKQIVITPLCLRQGLLLDEAAAGAWTDMFTGQVLDSAAALGERYDYDKAHAFHVADLCIRLFRELQADHQMDPRFEVMLKVAAILHEIGGYVSNRSHHKHSMYLIANSDVFGLSRQDMLFVGLIARYHRRSLPRPAHEGYATLDREGRVAVSKLAAILRVADALDRSHTQRVRDIAFSREGDQFIITLSNVEDVTLERLALEEKADMFELVYGKTVVLRAAQPVEGTV